MVGWNGWSPLHPAHGCCPSLAVEAPITSMEAAQKIAEEVLAAHCAHMDDVSAGLESACVSVPVSVHGFSHGCLVAVVGVSTSGNAEQ